jgi:hypothetical protein
MSFSIQVPLPLFFLPWSQFHPDSPLVPHQLHIIAFSSVFPLTIHKYQISRTKITIPGIAYDMAFMVQAVYIIAEV